MKLTTKQYQHFKGGKYKVYGVIEPLPLGMFGDGFRFVAKEAENCNEVDVFVFGESIYFGPFTNESMVLYCSEKTGEWWLREAGDFHGYKIHEDGRSETRFTLQNPGETFLVEVEELEL